MTRLFQGVYTAIVTPFTDAGAVDFSALQTLVERQIDGGVAGIVPCGTTGESPTLSPKEHMEVIGNTLEFARSYARNPMHVIAGTGSNSTDEAIEYSQEAEKLGVDGCLIVTPYYNKPPQRGLVKHFLAIDRSIGIPWILYNIKGRCGVNVETKTIVDIQREAQHLRGIKEASGDLAQIADVIKQLPMLDVLSGDDGLTAKVVALGGTGVISVASNVIPEDIMIYVRQLLGGEMPMQNYDALFKDLFIDTNPIPVKTALAMMGLCTEKFRLPLCEMEADKRSQLAATLHSYHIL